MNFHQEHIEDIAECIEREMDVEEEG